MTRFGLILLVGGLFAASPLTSFAQQQAPTGAPQPSASKECKYGPGGAPALGFLTSIAPEVFQPELASFRQGLLEWDYEQDRNLVIDYRFVTGATDAAAVAANLVACAPRVIFVTGTTTLAKAVKNATDKIPIVFLINRDPVAEGLVKRVDASPDNMNVTGFSIQPATNVKEKPDLAQEHLNLLQKLDARIEPRNGEVGLLVNKNSPPPDVDVIVKDVYKGVKFDVNDDEQDLKNSFFMAEQRHLKAMIVSPGGFFATRRKLLVVLAAAHSLPTLYPVSEFVDAGGLISYGVQLPNAFREAGLYVGRVLRGANPNSLAVRKVQSELAINLDTARALNLKVSAELMSRADKVVGSN